MMSPAGEEANTMPNEDVRRLLGEELETPQEAAERAVESILRATKQDMDAAIPLLILGVQAGL